MSRLHPDLAGLKSTTRALVDACGGSEAAAKILGKSASLIRSYGNHNNPERFMPLDDVMMLERCAPQPIVSEWMAARAKADPDRQRHKLSMADLARMAKEGGEAKMAIATAFADGPKLCAADRVAIARELREAIKLFSELLEGVEEGE